VLKWSGEHPDGAVAWWAELPSMLTEGRIVPAGLNPPVPDRAATEHVAPVGPVPGWEEADGPIGIPPELGVSSDYAFSEVQVAPDGSAAPVRWSPCRPVHYVIDATGAPDGFVQVVGRAVAEVSAATGLVFVYDGAVTEPAVLHRAPYQPERYGERWAPVLIRFADALAVPELAGSVAGLAWAVPVPDPTAGTSHLVSGAIHLDVELISQPGIGTDAAYLPVLRHELGHLVGLAHVEAPHQLMHAHGTAGITTFQDGDLSGLAVAGRGPCAPGI
jgi:hypothetical protein